MKKILVVGSLAYDHVMQYDGFFKDAMVPGNFNISLSTMNREMFFGGCSGNISYSLRLFDELPLIMTCVGKDFSEYRKWLLKTGVDISGVYESDKFMTASAFIVTDQNENQITLFDPGAMHGANNEASVRALVGEADGSAEGPAWAIIAPDSPSAMIKYAAECKAAGIPYIFDPGQQISIFKNEELIRAIQDADILIFNEYEGELLCKKLGISTEDLADMASVYIKTLGAKGCSFKRSEGEGDVSAVVPSKVVDPTGCGDAFRGGVLAGLVRGFSIEKACQMGALTATYNLECLGTQRHFFSIPEFSERFENSFGEAL